MLLMVSDSFLRLDVILTRTENGEQNDGYNSIATVPLQNTPSEPFPVTAGGTQHLHGSGTGKSSPIICSRLSLTNRVVQQQAQMTFTTSGQSLNLSTLHSTLTSGTSLNPWTLQLPTISGHTPWNSLDPTLSRHYLITP